MTSPLPKPRTLPLRGRVFRAVALAPEAPLAEWLELLDAALKRSPKRFEGKAVILNLGAFAPEAAQLDALLQAFATRRIRILGIENCEAGLVTADRPPLLIGGKPAGQPEELPADPAPTSLTIEGSVRSGQTIVFHEGDVTVMGSVSSGAEILAGGSIHVYGALRGRAIAGAAKNPRARIYCRKFEPELLGIDRLVRTAEDMGNHLRGQAVQIWSDGGAIKIAALG